MDFPGGPMIKNLLANARDTGLTPGSGKIPYNMEQLSLCATDTESILIEPVLGNKRGQHSEKLALCNKRRLRQQ